MGRSIPIRKEGENRYEKFEEFMTKTRDCIINKKYEDVFGENLRGAIENVSPIILYDICPDDALEVLEGKKEWDNCNGEWGWKESDSPVPIKGTKKIDVTIKILKNRLIGETQERKSTHVDAKTEMDSIINSYNYLKNYYSDSSQRPHGNTNNLDLENLSQMAYGHIIEIFDRLHDYPFESGRTKELHTKLTDEHSLKLPEYRTEESISEQDYTANCEKNGVRDSFSNIVNQDAKGIIVLPDSYSDETPAENFRKLLNIPWSLVIDYNQGTKDGLYATLSEEEKQNYPETMFSDTHDTLYIADGIHIHSWIFARGSNSKYFSLEINPTGKDIRTRNMNIARCIKETEKNNSNPFIVLLLYPEVNYISGLIEKLFNDDVYASNFEEKFRFIILAKNCEQKAEWNTYKKDKKYIEILSIKSSDLLSCVSEVQSIESETKKSFHLSFDKNDIELSDADLNKFYEAGIEFVDCARPRNNTDWDFYDGAEITWQEIQEGKAVKRNNHDNYKTRLTKLIKNNQGVTTEQFNYYPGSGGTTFLRQIAYDIDKSTREGSTLQCLPVFIKTHKPTLLLDALTQLTSIYGGSLLVVFESHVLSEEPYKNLQDELRKQEKHGIYFIRITPSISIKESILSTTLGKKERLAFNNLFKESGLLTDEQIKELNKRATITAIDYPLLARDSKDSGSYAMKHFVDNMLDNLSEGWKNVCALISYVHKYTGMSVSLSLFSHILNTENKSNRWPPEVPAAAKRLLMEVGDNGCTVKSWRPRYRGLGDCILANYFKEEDNRWMTPTNLYNISKLFIEECKYYKDQINHEDEQILQRLFTEKSEDDFRDFEEKSDFMKSFPLVIQEINDYTYIKNLMEEITKTYEYNPYFLAHYSRYLYEYTYHMDDAKEDDATFKSAQELIERATRCNEKSDKVYHMQGTLYNRMIRVFKRRNRSTQNNLGQSEIQKVKSWMDDAIKAFSTSEYYAPLNPYGYMTEGQTIQQGLGSIQLCLNESSYEFCEKDPWIGYVERFNEIVQTLSEHCKNSNDSRVNEEMYLSLCKFHMKLLAPTEEKCDSYYKKALSLSKTKTERVHFSQLYYWSCLYNCKLDNETISKALGRISEEYYDKLKKVLENAINDNCIQAFLQLHELRYYKDKDYSIDEAIEHWKRCVEKCKGLGTTAVSFTLMHAYYMLESYYAAKFIVDGVNGCIDEDDRRKYEAYRKETIEIAHKHDKYGTIHSYYFLGKESDARILLPSRESEDKRQNIECQIERIEKRNGQAVILPSGLKASFGASKKGQQNIGEKAFWNVGFRYEGVGLYDEKERWKEVFDEKEFRNEHDKHADDTSNKSCMDLGNKHTGVYIQKTNEVVTKNGYHYKVKSKAERVYNEADVYFELEQDPCKANFKWAINVAIQE